MSAVNRFIQRRVVPGVLPDITNSPHPILTRLYASRGISSAAQLERGAASLLPYSALKGIDSAVMLLIDALQQQQQARGGGDQRPQQQWQ